MVEGVDMLTAQYGRNMDQIHGLGAGVSMATSGAHAIEGGNWRIFNAMLELSKAGVYLNTTVSPVSDQIVRQTDRLGDRHHLSRIGGAAKVPY
jgi:hypothetical protein